MGGFARVAAPGAAFAVGRGVSPTPSSSASSRGPIPETDAPSGNFRKPELDEMGSDGVSYFRKNTLDEMTVGRTEKPVGSGKLPQKPGAPASNERSEALKGGANDSNSPKPIKRHKIGVGSYEDPADERARKRKPGKTGRPGR